VVVPQPIALVTTLDENGAVNAAIRDPNREVTIADEMMHDLAGYTPFAGRKLKGWPVTVLSREGPCRDRPCQGR
jgi:dihydroorotase-like cyclic amidohydrolase